MKLQTGLYEQGAWVWQNDSDLKPELAQVVIAFGSKALLADGAPLAALRQQFPHAQLVAASTSGEIVGERVTDDTVVATALYLEKGTTHVVSTRIGSHIDSFSAGAHLIQELAAQEGLKAVFVLSDGALVNGTELASGFNSLSKDVPVSGGLAGDADRFESTLVAHNDTTAHGMVVAIGFYGDAIHASHGSFGGWDEFGPERTITRSEKNKLMEIDGRPALDLYKTYLGPYSDELPGSALLFPLALREADKPGHLVRTILSLSEVDGSMTFAGNMPEGSTVRLMKANFDKLINAAGTAAHQATQADLQENQALLALCVSCVGRKLVLKERAEEEVAAVRQALPPQAHTLGFYSYGEISPYQNKVSCDLHNQTMTITLISESF
jgi:hypothetical protein